LSLLKWAKKRYEEGPERRLPDASPRNSGHSAGQTKEIERPEGWLQSLLELEGLGKEYWKDVDPDEFVRQLREGWE
jgi:hypothetical protein